MPGEDTKAFLQQAAEAGVPAMIPGAREHRPERSHDLPSVDRPVATVAVKPISAPESSGVERAREGGGDISERSPARRGGVAAILGAWLGYGIEQLRSAPIPAIAPSVAGRAAPDGPLH